MAFRFHGMAFRFHGIAFHPHCRKPKLGKRSFQKDPEGAVNLFGKLLTLAI